jgi:hypothetical protein
MSLAVVVSICECTDLFRNQFPHQPLIRGARGRLTLRSRYRSKKEAAGVPLERRRR